MRLAIPIKTRELVRDRYQGRCGYCGQRPDRVCIDHIHPVASGSRALDVNAIENLMPSCFSCNNYKSVFSLEQFRSEIQQQIARARQHSVNFRIAERYGLIEIKEKSIEFYFEYEHRSKRGGEK